MGLKKSGSEINWRFRLFLLIRDHKTVDFENAMDYWSIFGLPKKELNIHGKQKSGFKNEIFLNVS